MNERDRQHFEDILEFSERALRISNNLTYDTFVAQEAVLYSVRYCIVVIGESSTSLSPEAKALVPTVPWAQMAAMRHRLVHGYAAISDLIVYNTLAEDLPVLIDAARRVLAEHP